MIRRGNTGAKGGKSREIKTYRLLCPIRSQCCTNYNVPTGNLDSKSGHIVIDEFCKINEEMGKTVVMVTHDPYIASRCKRIIFLKDGMILEDLKKEVSEEEFYHQIIGKMEML